jgi:alpha-methylacyl-CoA racemase
VLEPGHDLNLQALTGVCHLGRDRSGAPQPSVLPVADFSSAMAAVSGICAALAKRACTGEGAVLDVAMADTVLSWTHTWAGVDLLAQARRPLRQRPLLRRIAERAILGEWARLGLFALPHYGLYQAGDGRWLALGIVDERHFWKSLCQAMGMNRSARLPPPARVALGPLIRRRLSAKFRRRDRAHWLEHLVAHGVPATPVLEPYEVLNEPQFRQRGLVGEDGNVRPPVPGTHQELASAPTLGQHTSEILRSSVLA